MPSHDGASLAIRLASESKPAAGDPHEGAIADEAEVELARDAAGDRRARRDRVLADPEHAGQVVAAPARQHAEDRAGHRAQRVGRGPGEPIAAERHRQFAAARGLQRERARVVEVAGVLAAYGEAVSAQGIDHARRGAAGPTAAGGGVDDQAHRGWRSRPKAGWPKRGLAPPARVTRLRSGPSF